jgi:hypothetical protein
MVLSVLPCSDDANCNQDNVEQIADHSDHEHEEDTCTPFCVCTCCGSVGFTVSIPFFDIQIEKYEITQSVISYDPHFISSYHYSFWQPPKI